MRQWLAMLFATCLLLGMSGTVMAQSPSDPDFSDLEPFVDGLMQAQLRATGAPGGVVAIVHRGEPLLIKGYGFADLEKQRPVDGALTMFRLASISKLFVGLSIAQLAQAGEIDLDADIESYLGPIPGRRFDDTLTIRHLLTHRSGLEDARYGVFHPDGTPAPPLADVIENTLPQQIRRPGAYPAYSNHGYVLLGRIIEQVTGMPYHQYVEDRVLRPIGMEYASARQPVPDPLQPLVVTSYGDAGGVPQPKPFETVSASPGGAISASAGAMAKFMAFMMEAEPRPDVLSSEWIERAQAELASSDPRVNGMGFGFVRQTLHGRPGWYHTGGLRYAFSRLTILPEEQFGVFLAYNSNQTGGAITNPLYLLLDRYYPAPPRDALPPPPAEESLLKYEGAYQTTGSFFGSFGALASAADQAIVRVVGPGLIEIDRWGSTTRWQWAGEDRFRQITGSDASEFGDVFFLFEGEGEDPTSFARLSQPTRDNVRMSGMKDIRTARAMLDWGWWLGGALAVGLAASAIWAVSAGRMGLAAGMVTGVASLGMLGWFLVSYGAGTGSFNIDALGFGPDPSTQWLMAQPYVATVLALVALALLGGASFRQSNGLAVKALTGLFGGYWIAAVLFLTSWNLML
ncbi:MAG: serine hydrolase domain-containing protein [Erythrobacter sp.]|uniref:serine hydrolase domain-containing protein n=1 Tax=Erythrobacter sp. TaxID=1042 RepID=UPI0026311634|nr:serine hydrolase domain-containing protein [Erythrobacter sp.]MDJ0978145.1 serine hydrolase domain-containing protein [Erythrobacter sp.]